MQMDQLRELSYLWDESQRRTVQQELVRKGLSETDAWDQTETLNRQYPDYSYVCGKEGSIKRELYFNLLYPRLRSLPVPQSRFL